MLKSILMNLMKPVPSIRSLQFPRLRISRALPVLWLGLISITASAQNFTVHVDTDEPGPVISRYLYGHFLEHLGRAVYDGVWVGTDSDIPNTNGLRNDVVAALKELHIPVVRWPGGCYADEYHWRDGIGPRDQRATTINYSWGGVEENNEFGTHEYFAFLEAIGAEPYIAGNLGTGSGKEMMDWLEYTTSSTHSTLADERRANGREQPWAVPFFGVGNESWGCGGQMTPDYYVDLYKRYSEFLEVPGKKLNKIASGGHDAGTEWTEVLSKLRSNIDGISHHYYTTPSGVWARKGSATNFKEDQWISTLYRALQVEGNIAAQEAILDAYNPRGNIGLFLDEWGTWYDPTPGTSPLFQQNTLRDAFVAALHFNVFHRHAERLHMANIAQTVNVLQAMILTKGDQMVRTPTYYAFQMYIPFQDATSLPVKIDGNNQYNFADYEVPALSVTAARGTDGKLYVSLANLNPNQSSEVTVELDANARNPSGTILTADRMNSYNDFGRPESVKPASFDALQLQGGNLKLTLPAKSIVVIALED